MEIDLYHLSRRKFDQMTLGLGAEVLPGLRGVDTSEADSMRIGFDVQDLDRIAIEDTDHRSAWWPWR